MTPSVYSVVLDDDLVRLPETNKKVLKSTKQPIKLPSWTKKENLTPTVDFPATQLACIHNGYSNMVTLDFDSKELFLQALKIDESLAPQLQCRYIALSITTPIDIDLTQPLAPQLADKDFKGGHFYYHHTSNELTNYINNPNGKKQNNLDTLYGNTLTYFANKRNKTKQILRKCSYRELTTIPYPMQMFVKSVYSIAAPATSTKKLDNYNYQNSKLGYLAERALEDEKTLDIFLSIITPQRYKAILSKNPKYQFPRYHPDNLPETESAHMYIVSLSGVLMLDQSIDEETHRRVILHINSLFSNPLDEKRVLSIINRDINSENYNFNEDWKKNSFIVYSKNKHPLEVFLLSESGQINYLVYNHYYSSVNILGCVTFFRSASSLIDFLYSETGIKLHKDKIVQQSLYIDVIFRPDEPYGYIAPKYNDDQVLIDKAKFNVYVRSDEQKVFYDPDSYKDTWSEEEKLAPYDETHPRYPTTTLKALENAVGPHLYTKFLPFMSRKYKTRNHSPLFFVLYGVPHSFKSAIVNGVFAPLSRGRYRTLSLDVMLDKYNDWQISSDLILLDEVHHYLASERTKLIKLLNELTGSSTINGVRRMHQSIDSSVYPNELTFFLTTNEIVQLTTEVNDRRMVVFKSLTPVSEALNLSNHEIERAIKRETLDFAYYLSQVPPLQGDDYITNYSWRDENYKLFIENSQTLEHRIVKAIDDKNYDSLIQLFIEAGLKIKDIVTCMTEHKQKEYKLRLHNTREEYATTPSIVDYTNLDEKRLLKLLQLSKQVKFKRVDYEDSIPTGNKKTEIVISMKHIPPILVDELRNKEVEPLPATEQTIEL